MNAALPVASTAASGSSAVMHAAEPRAGRGSAQVTSDFRGQLAQALGATGADPSATSALEQGTAPPQDDNVPPHAVPQGAAPAAQQTATLTQALATLGQPASAQAPAPVPDSTGEARRAPSSHDRDSASGPLRRAAALAPSEPVLTEPVQAVAGQDSTAGKTTTGTDLSAATPSEQGTAPPQDRQAPPQPVAVAQPAAQAELASGPAPKTTGAPPAPSSRDRRSASEPPRKVAVPAGAGSQQGPSPAPAATTLAAPVLTEPVQAIAGQGSSMAGDATGNGAVQGASPDLERFPARHDSTTANVAVPQDGGLPASPREVPQQHLASVAAPALNTPEIASSPVPIDPPTLSSSAQPGAQPGALPPLAHAAPSSTATPPSPTHTSLPGPAAQVTPALVHVAATLDGSQRVTVRLDPVELGEVRVRIERPREGPVQVTVEASRPETLQLLRQDEPALHRALDQAGLPSEGRIVVLQSSAEGSGQQQSTTEMGGNPSAGGGGQGSGRGSGQGWSQHGGHDGAATRQSRQPGTWLRAGVNITA